MNTPLMDIEIITDEILTMGILNLSITVVHFPALSAQDIGLVINELLYLVCLGELWVRL